MAEIVSRMEEIDSPHDRLGHERTDAEDSPASRRSATECVCNTKVSLTTSLKRSTKQILMRLLQEVAEARKDDLRMLLITTLRRTRFGKAI